MREIIRIYFSTVEKDGSVIVAVDRPENTDDWNALIRKIQNAVDTVPLDMGEVETEEEAAEAIKNWTSNVLQSIGVKHSILDPTTTIYV